MKSLLWKQPLKSIVLAGRVLTIVCCLPYWTLRYILPSSRPRPTWSLERTLITRLISSLTALTVKIGIGIGRDVTLTTMVDSAVKEGARMVWIRGVTMDLVGQKLSAYAEENGVQPADRVPGYWYGEPLDTIADSEFVGYHIHGGAMITNAAYPEDAVSAGIRQYCFKKVRHIFVIDYRLSTSAPLPPSNPFPAALFDVLAGYRYLVEVFNIPPEKILLSGDSAGGNLAVALTRHLISLNSPTLRKPGAVFLVSPSVDLSESHTSRSDPENSAIVNKDVDIVNETVFNTFIQYMRTSYAGPSLDKDLLLRSEPLVSPASLYIEESKGLFKGFPRTFIAAGGSEYFRDEVRTLRDRIKADSVVGDSDGWVLYMELADAIHDFVSFRFHAPERDLVLKKLGDWL